jgi:hypothetical protein
MRVLLEKLAETIEGTHRARGDYSETQLRRGDPRRTAWRTEAAVCASPPPRPAVAQ